MSVIDDVLGWTWYASGDNGYEGTKNESYFPGPGVAFEFYDRQEMEGNEYVRLRVGGAPYDVDIKHKKENALYRLNGDHLRAEFAFGRGTLVEKVFVEQNILYHDVTFSNPVETAKWPCDTRTAIDEPAP